ncbi:MAG: class II aldolase/adducin family protein [Verrucomicrobia bacterium]|nr:class II aldolase/adducin family protein [Verrucomicrobiota bacterium]
MNNARSFFRDLRREVWHANVSLSQAGLVTMHSGNASGIDRERGLILIKPSGVDYETLKSDHLALVDLDGKPVKRAPDGVVSRFKPSVDALHHALLYRGDNRLGGVVHTHSNHATAFAAAGLAIPCVLTAIADEFGGEIPCAPYVDNEGDHIARAVFAHRGRGPAVLLGNHGVFAFDATPAKALKAAIMVEDVARTVWLARHLGELKPLPPPEIEKWWGRYHRAYGQR